MPFQSSENGRFSSGQGLDRIALAWHCLNPQRVPRACVALAFRLSQVAYMLHSPGARLGDLGFAFLPVRQRGPRRTGSSVRITACCSVAGRSRRCRRIGLITYPARRTAAPALIFRRRSSARACSGSQKCSQVRSVTHFHAAPCVPVAGTPSHHGTLREAALAAERAFLASPRPPLIPIAAASVSAFRSGLLHHFRPLEPLPLLPERAAPERGARACTCKILASCLAFQPVTTLASDQ